MRAGVTGSVIAHVAVIVIAIIGLNSAQALKPDEEQSISVDLVPITDTTHVRAGSEKSKIIDTKTPAVVQSSTPPTPMQPPGNTSQQIPTPNTADKPAPTVVTNTAPAPTPTPPTPQPVVPAPPPPEPQPTAEAAPTPPPPTPKAKPQPSPTPTPDPQLASSASTSTDSVPPAPMKLADLEQQRADLKKQQQAEAKAAADDAAKAAAKAAAAKAQADAKAVADAKADADAKAAATAKAKADAEAKTEALAAAKAAAAKKAAAAQAQQVAQAKASADKAARAADEISQLINTEQSAGGRTGAGGTPTAGKASGADAQLTQSEIGLLMAQIKKCWNLLPSQISSGVTAELVVTLNQDGSISGKPKIVSADNSDIGGQIAQSAQRAVLECQPYKLPPAKYAQWNQLDLVMDPAGQ